MTIVDMSSLRQQLSKIDLDPGYISKLFKDQSVREFIIKNNIESIIDVGCDTAYINKLLIESNKIISYFGIDYRDSIIYDNLCSNGIFYKTENVFLTIQEIILKNKIDCLLLLDVIEHFDSKEKGIEIFNKICNLPFKYLIISTPNQISNIVNWPKYHNYEYTYKELEDCFNQNGLKILDVHGWSMSNDNYLNNYAIEEFTILPIEIQRVLFAWNNYKLSRDVIYFLEKI